MIPGLHDLTLSPLRLLKGLTKCLLVLVIGGAAIVAVLKYAAVIEANVTDSGSEPKTDASWREL